MLSPRLTAALEAITLRTNLSTGLTHPNDKNAAKELFSILHRCGETLGATEIEHWAIQNGWEARFAADLGILAQNIGNGNRVIIKGSPWWKAEYINSLVNK